MNTPFTAASSARLISKILVPLDFSPHSAEAVRFAADIARSYGASLTLLHVYEPVALMLPEGYVPYNPEQLTAILAGFYQQLLTAKQNAEAAGAPDVQVQQLQGSVEGEIIDFARTAQVDLIVMGTHGRSGLQHFLLGSVLERVLRRASCPVLAVRAPSSGPDA